MVFVSDPKKPVGGHILVRVSLCIAPYHVLIHCSPLLSISKSGSCVSIHHPKLNPTRITNHLSCHRSATRVYLRKGRGEERVAKIYDSPDMPENECSYTISGGGIADVFL